MKVVLDTNVLVSAIVFGGKPRVILELIVVEKKLTGVISKMALNELLDVLKVKFKYSRDHLIKIEDLIEENFVVTNPRNIPKIIKEDDFDNQFLAILNETEVNYIISGDNHLLKVQKYKGVLIITPHYFVDKISPVLNENGGFYLP